MKKFLFFTDVHYKSSVSSRWDNYRESILNKLTEIVSISEREKVDYILFGGDLFDVPNPNNSLVYDIVSIFKKFKVPVLGIVGSHDYFGYQKVTLKRSAIGILHKADLIDLLDPRFDFGNIRDVGENVIICGTPHTFDLVETGIFQKKEEGTVQIQLVHGDVVPFSLPWPHLLIDKKLTESDVVFIGHYHPGWRSPIEIEGSYYINPGSIGRTQYSKNLWIPKVIIITIDEGSVYYEEIKLSSVIENPFYLVRETEETDLPLSTVFHFIDNYNVTDKKLDFYQFAKDKGYSDASIEVALHFLESLRSEDK